MTGDSFVAMLFLVASAFIMLLVWQGFATYRARSTAKRAEAYHVLVEQVAASQAEIAAALADIRPRIAAIEKLIRDVG